MNWNERYAIAQINWTMSPKLESGEVYKNILGRVNNFYSQGGTVEIHHFNKKNFSADKDIAWDLKNQSDKLERSKTNSLAEEQANSSLRGGLLLYSQAYKKGKLPSAINYNFQGDWDHCLLLARDKDNNITAALNATHFPKTDESVPMVSIGGVSSVSPGHASVLQHAMLHHIAGEQSGVMSQVFNPTVNLSPRNPKKILPWSEENQKQQDNALRYHEGIGRRIEKSPNGNIDSNWFKSDVTRLVRNTRTRTNVKHIYN